MRPVPVPGRLNRLLDVGVLGLPAECRAGKRGWNTLKRTLDSRVRLWLFNWGLHDTWLDLMRPLADTEKVKPGSHGR